ncbi:MAG: site-specific integrase [Candidatus Pacebacteria bacterium]|nr:site-specific integrase [Candidatus Paceibacterota bacterium]
MARKNHILVRQGFYYYRRRVPDRLVARVGRRMIQFSLRTSDRARAAKLGEIEDVKWSAQFADAASKIGASDPASDGPSTAKANPLSPHQAMRLVWDYVARMDSRNAEEFKKDGPASDKEREEIKTNLEIELQAYESLDDPTSRQWAYSSAEKILAANKLPLDDPAGVGLEFLELVWRGVRELDRRRLARLDGNYAPTVDPLFDPGKPPSLTVGELAKELLDEKREDAKINGGTKKSFEKHKASLALIVEILGDDRSASAVNYDDCKMVRATLARVPTNRTKLFRGLTVEESIERAEAEGLPRLSPITQQTYLTALRELLELARMKGIVKANHAASMRSLKRDPVAAGDKRMPLTLDQIARFFKSDFYAACAAGGRKPYAVADKDWRFWLPLLCLFMGLRPNEACQLRKGDVRVTSIGVPYLDIVASPNDGDESISKKTLKTETSRRRIPIHSELLKLGFMDFVATRESHEALLFSVRPDKDGNHARYALKRFAETYLPAAIELAPRQSFYSLRHSFRDALRRSNAPPEILRAFGGWTDGASVSDAYGDKYDPDHTVAHMAKISFPGLDLSHLAVRA